MKTTRLYIALWLAGGFVSFIIVAAMFMFGAFESDFLQPWGWWSANILPGWTVAATIQKRKGRVLQNRTFVFTLWYLFCVNGSLFLWPLAETYAKVPIFQYLGFSSICLGVFQGLALGMLIADIDEFQ